MKKPSRKVITAITIISLILLSIFCIFLLKLEHDWRVREKTRVQLLEEVTPQLEEFHKKRMPLLTQLETQAVWEDKELLLIYRIEVPNYLIGSVNYLMDSKYCKDHPDFKEFIITSLYYDLEYISTCIQSKIETDIEYTATTQFVTTEGTVIMWASEYEIIKCVVPYEDKNNLGSVEFVGSAPEGAVGTSSYEYTPIIDHEEE